MNHIVPFVIWPRRLGGIQEVYYIELSLHTYEQRLSWVAPQYIFVISVVDTIFVNVFLLCSFSM